MARVKDAEPTATDGPAASPDGRLSGVMQVTDLRGHAAPGSVVLPRAALDVEAATELVAETLADVRDRGAAAVLDAGERFDGVRRRRCACRRTCWPRRWIPCRRRCAPLWPPPSNGCAPSTMRNDAPPRSSRSPKGERHPSLGSGAAGWPLRPWRPGGLPQQCGHERGAGAAGRSGPRSLSPHRRSATPVGRTWSSSPPARCSASTRSTRPAERRRLPCSPTAPSSRTGSGASRWRWSRVRATSTSPRRSEHCAG